MLKEQLSEPVTLVHYNPDQTLWIDLDASKDFGFGCIVFHVAEDQLVRTRLPAEPHSLEEPCAWPARRTIQPIMFLFRLLTSAERNYWPTELKMAGFVWVIKKIRHLIESSKHKVVIQTDHSAILDIIKQRSIVTTTSTMRMNLRLVRASQFLCQFNLDVRHKPGKENIVPDALSRLASTNPSTLPPDYNELDALYTATLIGIDENFRKKILAAYKKDPWWNRVSKQIDENEARGEDANILLFVWGRTLPPTEADPYFEPRPLQPEELAVAITTKGPNASTPNDKLLYHVDRITGMQRLCIPLKVAPEVIAIAHGEGHPRFAKCHKIILKSWYIRGLTSQLCAYIRHCPQCLIMQT